ncbi:ABC transporter ATP-binding protein [Paenibacillus sp. JGP012]|uniref:ABC transporter ATP-binding protein n=1 Tax=Paenibacillus sp. JGP012 TaxID=2735914 RepID=UPI0016164CBC|nr:ABC transporter ATP-binding protein [Paenibacillus sp. JGP012]
MLNLLAFILFSTLTLGTGYIVSRIFQNLTGDINYFGINVLLALILGIAIGRIILNVVCVYSWAILNFAYLALIRSNLLKRMTNQKKSKLSSKSSGELLNVFRDDANAVIDYLEYWVDGSAAFVYTLVALTVMFTIDPMITMVIIIPITIILVLVKYYNKKVERLYSESREATGAVTGFIGEAFSTVHAVKVASAEKNIVDHFVKLNEERKRISIKSTMLQSLIRTANTNVSDIAIGVILMLVASSLRNGTFSVADFVLFTTYLVQVSGSISEMGGFAAIKKSAEASLKRMNQVIPDHHPGELIEYGDVFMSGSLPPVVELDKKQEDILETVEINELNFQYPNSTNGIKNINLTLKRGSLTVVTGQIGSGKSTLLQVVLGLLRKDSGEIKWNNSVIDDPNTFFIPPRCAYTPQVPNLFSETIRDNILLGQTVEDEKLQDVLRLAVLEKDIDNLENGINTVIGARGAKLSGGQIQRVSIARMLMTNSELYIFDDISSALDLETEQTLWSRLFDESDSTCLAVSHRKPTLQRADQIIVLKEGEISAIGKLEDLLHSSEELKHIWFKDHNTTNEMKIKEVGESD